MGGIKMDVVGGLLDIAGIAIFIVAIILVISFRKKKLPLKQPLILMAAGIALLFIGVAVTPSPDSAKSDKDNAAQSSKAVKSSKSSKKRSNTNASSKTSSSSESEKSNTSSSSKPKQSLQDKANKIFNDMGGNDEYPLVSRIEVNGTAKNITGVSLWCDGGLQSADAATLKHYFSLAAQVGNQLLDDGSYKVPFVQVYAEQTKIARSEYTNTSQMKDLR